MLRSALSLIVALAIGWSAVADNTVVCNDALGLETGTESQSPCSDDGQAPAGCAGCPCRLPIVEARAQAALVPVELTGLAEHRWHLPQSLGIGAPAPALPPPLA